LSNNSSEVVVPEPVEAPPSIVTETSRKSDMPPMAVESDDIDEDEAPIGTRKF
jgi:hypothetical protein